MIVRCTSCNSAFAVDDAKVENKKFAFKCPKCSTENIIDNMSPSPSADDAHRRGETGGTTAEMGLSESSSVDTAHDQIRRDHSAAIGIAESESEHYSEMDDTDFNIALSEDTETVEDEAPSGETLIVDDAEPEETDPSGFEVIEEDTSLTAGINEESAETGKEKEEVSLKESLTDEDEEDERITIDLESLDIELEEGEDDEALGEDISDLSETPSEEAETLADREPESDDLPDIDALDADLTEEERATVLEDKDAAEEGVEGIHGKIGTAAKDDDDGITLDMDSLDIELAEEQETTAGEKKEDGSHEDMEIEEISHIDSELKDLSLPEDDLDEDESITLDLDSLDLDLVEDDTVNKGEIPDQLPDDIDMQLESDGHAVRSAEEAPAGEEDITLDIDSLDIDLEEDHAIKTGETPDEMAAEGFEVTAGISAGSEEQAEEDITLDLESLDIELEETEEIKEGEVLDEDEKLTLEDAGLTFDELTSEEAASVIYDGGDTDDEEDDIRITIDEIDPSLDIDNLGKGLEEPEETLSGEAPAEDLMPVDIDEDLDSAIEKELEDIKLDADVKDEEISEFDLDEDELKLSEIALDSEDELDDMEKDLIDDDLPEFDLSEFDEDIDTIERDDDLTGTESAAAGMAKAVDDMIRIEDDGGYSEEEVSDYEFLPVSKGSVNFSIDYSLAYSRLGAFLRLICLFFIALIPHFIVFLVYSVLSLILGLLNHIVIMAAGNPVEDFHTIQENTLRYFLSISASLLGIVEEMPNFAGRDDIDYSLQLNVKYPVKYSNLLAALRLSVAGILIITLPHLIVLALLSLVIPFAYLAGIISILISGRWPHFLFEFLTMYYRSIAKVGAFIIGLIDNYPPFKFS